jgi:hypothetical protein
MSTQGAAGARSIVGFRSTDVASAPSPLPRAQCLMYLARRAATGMCRNLGGHWRRYCLRRALYLRQFHSDVDSVTASSERKIIIATIF